MQYRKKPVVIAAVLWSGGNINEVMEFMSWRNASYDTSCGLQIHTLEGTHSADVGDYIIRGVKGEYYPCKPDIFAMTYDEVK